MLAPLTIDRLGPLIRGAREIYVSGCAAEIPGLPEMLAAATPAVVTGIFSPLLNTRSYAEPAAGRRCRTFFLNKELKVHLREGWVDFCPWSYSQIHVWLCAPKRFDVAIVMVSPADAAGLHSFGVQSDFIPDLYERVGRLVGIVNPNMPSTFGEPGIPSDRFDALLELNHPLLATPAGDRSSPPDDATTQIASRISAMIPDGATVQMGMGRLPQALTAELTGHRNLQVHAGLVDDGILLLDDAGALNPDRPVVTGTAIGTSSLYERLHKNSRFSFRAVRHTHSREAISTIPGFIAVNAGLQIDLFGQISSEGSGERLLASPGGLPEFVRGARASTGGRAIAAIQAKRGREGESSVVARLDPPYLVTTPHTDTDTVVTEYGSAELRGLSLDERAEAIIAIAAPEHRSALVESWSDIRARGFS